MREEILVFARVSLESVRALGATRTPRPLCRHERIFETMELMT